MKPEYAVISSSSQIIIAGVTFSDGGCRDKDIYGKLVRNTTYNTVGCFPSLFLLELRLQQNLCPYLSQVVRTHFWKTEDGFIASGL